MQPNIDMLNIVDEINQLAILVLTPDIIRDLEEKAAKLQVVLSNLSACPE